VQQQERNIAQTLQAALQPPPPDDLPGLALEGLYRPALQEAGVGGDGYDVFPVEKGCTALVVFDVAGKGLAAASEVATVRNMMRYGLYTGTTVSQTVTTLNRVLAEQNLLTGFATLFVGAYDQAAQTLTYVNCGQEPGLIWRAFTGEVEMLPPTGPVLGGFGEGEFDERVVLLAPGDALALFTDGLTEVGPTRRDLLEVEGVADILSECCGADGNARTGAEADQKVQRVLSCLVSGVDAYARGGVRDDIALLVGVVHEAAGSAANGGAPS
jgi:serine phosphatase RsbU (regulator of sigma subunit)